MDCCSSVGVRRRGDGQMGDGGWRGVRGGGTAWITRSRRLLDRGLGGVYRGRQRRRRHRPPTHPIIAAVAHSRCPSPSPPPLCRRPPRPRAPSSGTSPTIPPPRCCRRHRCHPRRWGHDDDNDNGSESDDDGGVGEGGRGGYSSRISTMPSKTKPT